MDILKPQLIRIGNRFYRKNPSLNKDVNTAEEDELECDDNVQVCGYNDEVCDFKLMVEETDKGHQVRMNIPSAFFKHIIGRKGETKRRIETETKTQIRIPKVGIEGEIVIAAPEKKGVISAKTRIDVIVDSARQREPFTHFLSIPVNGEKVQDKFEEFKSDVLRKFDGDRGIEASIFQKPKKLHLTLGRLVLLNDAEVQTALETLQECKQDLIDPILHGQPLNLKMEGLEYMNDDPSAVDVLYAKVQQGDEADRLQMLADRLVDRFSSTGLMQKEYDRVKLHVTVMNTLFRQDMSSPPNKQDGQRRNKFRESFDAANLMKEMKYFDFGTNHMAAVHLSKLYSPGPNGYYGCAGFVKLP